MKLELNAIYKYHFVKLKMEKIIVKNAVQDIILILLHQLESSPVVKYLLEIEFL